MLTLFILPSNAENADIKKTVQCFKGKIVKWMIPCMNWEKINAHAKQTPWYGVFYDNELIDIGVKQALVSVFKNPQFDIIQLYKLTDKITLNSRIFRSCILLRGTFVPLASRVRYGAILDGWVLEHQEVTNEKGNKGKNRSDRECDSTTYPID
jgi:hypothetical protein